MEPTAAEQYRRIVGGLETEPPDEPPPPPEPVPETPSLRTDWWAVIRQIALPAALVLLGLWLFLHNFI
jgi:hypothetical protein